MNVIIGFELYILIKLINAVCRLFVDMVLELYCGAIIWSKPIIGLYLRKADVRYVIRVSDLIIYN